MKNFYPVFMAIAAILFMGFGFAGCETDDNKPDITSLSDPHEGEVLIFSAYAGFHVNGPTHNFVELYNPTDKEINLKNCTLQYAGYDNDAGTWVAIPLTGTIKPKHSYLILGENTNDGGGARIVLQNGEGDVNEELMLLGNRGFRIALIKGTALLDVDNPFNTDGNGAKVSGFIDFVGSRNDLNNILVGYKGPAGLENTLENFPRNSNQESIRRKDLIYRDNNAEEFVSVRSTVARSAVYPHGVNDSELGIYKPKNTKRGAWDPFLGIEGWQPDVTYTVTQIGGAEGTAATTGIQFSFSAVIDSRNVTAADITVSGAAAKGESATFAKSSGNNWLLSPITVNDAGNATVSISKAGIEAAAKNVLVHKEGVQTSEVKAGSQDALAGKLLILQAYAPSGGPAGASHPFVELYNTTNAAINLSGITLFFANGNTGTTTDEAWRKITLTGTIPSEGSFLILGPKAANTSSTNYIIDTKHGANYGDINDDNFTLNNNAYKIAIIRTASINDLNVQNPFTMDGAGIAAGYIDIVGAHNAANNTINGYEAAPARCSASEAVRRKNLTDTNNNQGISTLYASGTGDFDSIRYATGSGYMGDALLELRHPRNSKAGKWNPFAQPLVDITYSVTQIGGEDGTATTTGIQFTFNAAIDDLNVTANDITISGLHTESIHAEKGSAIFTKSSGNNWLLSPITVNSAGDVTISISKTGIEAAVKYVTVYKEGEQIPEVIAGTQDDLAGKLLILQAYAPSGSPAGASHPFVELYNTTNAPIDLSGIILFFANGNTGTTTDASWRKIVLSGSIPSEGSFLVLGPKAATTTGTNYIIDTKHGANYGDINDDNFTLNNNAYKIAIIRTDFDNELNVQNPFTMDGAGIADGYIDMVGAHNAANNTINGYEAAPARCSASEAVRRKNLTDTNNNQGISTLYASGTGDFDSIRYATGSGYIGDVLLELRHPRNSSAGKWDPFAQPPADTQALMIFQVYGAGTTENDNTAGTHSFIELYNNSNTPINLSTYSVHYADGTSSGVTTVAAWTKINLTGIVPANSSYLIRGKQMRQEGEITGVIGRLNLINVTPDVDAPEFTLSNRSYKVALMSNQDTITAANPWGTAACLDLTSVLNTAAQDSIDAAKGEDDLAAVKAATASANTISKQAAWRRTSLIVTNVTLTDFTRIAYNLAANETNDALIAKFRPRTIADGSYTPQF